MYSYVGKQLGVSRAGLATTRVVWFGDMDRNSEVVIS